MKKKILAGLALGVFLGTGLAGCGTPYRAQWPGKYMTTESSWMQSENERKEHAQQLIGERYLRETDYDRYDNHTLADYKRGVNPELDAIVDDTLDNLGYRNVYDARNLIRDYATHSDAQDTIYDLHKATVKTLKCVDPQIEMYLIEDKLIDIVINEHPLDADQLSDRVCEETKDYGYGYF